VALSDTPRRSTSFVKPACHDACLECAKWMRDGRCVDAPGLDSGALDCRMCDTPTCVSKRPKHARAKSVRRSEKSKKNQKTEENPFGPWPSGRHFPLPFLCRGFWIRCFQNNCARRSLAIGQVTLDSVHPRAIVFHIDRRPGKQPPGSSIAGSKNTLRLPWSRCAAGVIERIAPSPDGLLGSRNNQCAPVCFC
jgi:hypothetical protein